MGLGDEILATYRARKLKEENPDEIGRAHV